MFCTFMKNIHYPKNIQFENKFILYIFRLSPHTTIYILQTEMYIINLRSSYCRGQRRKLNHFILSDKKPQFLDYGFNSLCNFLYYNPIKKIIILYIFQKTPISNFFKFCFDFVHFHDFFQKNFFGLFGFLENLKLLYIIKEQQETL